MNIGQASLASGVSAKMIRHYESLGLLPKARRTDAGYRQYDDVAVHQLRFIRRARDLGFDTKEIATLLALWRNKRRSSAEVKRVALVHMKALDERIAALQSVQRTLSHLAHCCAGDDRPDCPILDDLAHEAPRPLSGSTTP
jgi:MerR family copper efflux transcriptional regulator